MNGKTRTAATVARTGRQARASAPGEFSIDELAREAAATVRNVRAYQERGLLPPPERRGRKGIYTEAHLARLRLINRLLERGYTLANIGELVQSWEQGRDLTEVLGLERALTLPFSQETPRHYSMVELLRRFGPDLRPGDLARVIELGLLRREGLEFVAPDPRMIEVASELVREGIPLKALLELVGGLRRNVEAVAEGLVGLVVGVVDRYGDDLPPAEDVARLAGLIGRLRPQADMAVASEVSRALEKALNRFLGDRVALVLDHLHRAKVSGGV
ncbi:MAG TPA: MerR family transcriptional regulator [Nevskiaceae bacterium]|nr:MerR family transcriptional regulator [Nevskiaceae bacterium]